MEKFAIFILERFRSMMLILLCDIFTHCVTLGWAHGECSIALLPGKRSESDFLMNPSRGNRFHLAQYVRKPMGRLQTDQKMHMIGHPANFLRYAFELIDHPAQKGVEARSPFGGYCGCPVFGAENNMVMQGEMR